ncbi:MAG: PRC-barrel domain-containing protein [Thermoleophilia bacterium]|nr:PRC-barrel domain-containing protein [Thermoleophilia bacterium]
MTGDPVSWLVIEPGWTVYDAQGEKVGKVKEVEGDLQTGIFHGIRVDRGLLGEESEHLADDVAEIHEGHLHLR